MILCSYPCDTQEGIWIWACRWAGDYITIVWWLRLMQTRILQLRIDCWRVWVIFATWRWWWGDLVACSCGVWWRWRWCWDLAPQWWSRRHSVEDPIWRSCMRACRLQGPMWFRRLRAARLSVASTRMLGRRVFVRLRLIPGLPLLVVNLSLLFWSLRSVIFATRLVLYAMVSDVI